MRPTPEEQWRAAMERLKMERIPFTDRHGRLRWFDAPRAERWGEQVWTGHAWQSQVAGFKPTIETLYCTAVQHLYVLRVEREGDGYGPDFPRELDEAAAYAWLLKNGHEDDIPAEDLAELED